MIYKLTLVFLNTHTAHGIAGEGGKARIRRTSSLPNINDEEISAITLEDIHNIMNEDDLQSPSHLKREDLRKSTRRLKERIQMQ